jgi:phospholipid/cholesterol/gamma-HCH transport system permease protein
LTATASSTHANTFEAASHRWQGEGAAWVLQLAGDWRGAAAAALTAAPQAMLAQPGSLRLQADALQAWDAGLAAALREQLAPLARAGWQLQLAGLPHDVRAVLALALPAPGAQPSPPPARARGLAALGERVLAARAEARTTVSFFGEVLLGCFRVLRGNSNLRVGELLRQVDRAGPLSLPIVTLTCFLVGLMLAYMGGAQLDRMGAQSFIADIVTVGMVRELAGLFTGVILAGRIGAAYAAQLATMKTGEEIDALRAWGVDPIDHLVLPRVLALLLVAPLVWAYGALVGVLAGLVPTSLVYGVPAVEYLHQALSALTWTHLWVGMLKCMFYAALLGLAGCREGLHAGRNAQAVGEATTRAVVKGLVWIIAAACVSTIVFQSLGL